MLSPALGRPFAADRPWPTAAARRPRRCGFIWENLIDARRKFNRMSYAAAWVIFFVNVWQGLVVAIGTGLVWATVSFTVMYARKSKLHPPISGSDHCSTALRSAAQEMKLGVIGAWCAPRLTSPRYHALGSSAHLPLGTIHSLLCRPPRIFRLEPSTAFFAALRASSAWNLR